MLLEAVSAIIKLGLPILGLSWLLLSRLYARGILQLTDDAQDTDAQLKALKKDKNAVPYQGFVHSRWMKFGGGFYGLAALWTFVIIEIEQAVEFFADFPGFAGLFDQGVVNLLVQIFVNQIKNFVAAMVWFLYWGAGGASIGLWILIAYASFQGGNALAKLTGKTIR